MFKRIVFFCSVGHVLCLRVGGCLNDVRGVRSTRKLTVFTQEICVCLCVCYWRFLLLYAGRGAKLGGKCPTNDREMLFFVLRRRQFVVCSSGVSSVCGESEMVSFLGVYNVHIYRVYSGLVVCVSVGVSVCPCVHEPFTKWNIFIRMYIASV